MAVGVEEEGVEVVRGLEDGVELAVEPVTVIPPKVEVKDVDEEMVVVEDHRAEIAFMDPINSSNSSRLSSKPTASVMGP